MHDAIVSRVNCPEAAARSGSMLVWSCRRGTRGSHGKMLRFWVPSINAYSPAGNACCGWTSQTALSGWEMVVGTRSSFSARSSLAPICRLPP